MAEFVEILDSIMGSHKTNGIIKWMDENPDERYMYVSPLLSEVDEKSRLQTDLKYITFESPESSGDVPKSEDLLEKLKCGVNICCTHALYLLMDKRHLEEINKHGYIVIIDEELGVIESFDKYSADDVDLLLRDNNISISPTDGMISWIGLPVGNECQYRPFANLCNSKALYAVKRKTKKTDKDDDGKLMVTQLPIELFTSAKRVIIMTYMFEKNILDCFLKLKGIVTKEFEGVETTVVSKEYIRSLITLIPPSPEVKYISMSSGGYKEMNQDSCTLIANYIRGVCRNAGATTTDVMYTFPKEYVSPTRSNGKRIRPKSFVQYSIPKLDIDGQRVKNKQGEDVYITEPCWLYSSCRATNKYSFKWCLVHCYDRYPHKTVNSYLQDYGHSPSSNVFATSEICQWVWRSRVRNGEPIVLAIGSRRMYNLFNKWLLED